MPVYLVGYANRMMYSEQSTILLPPRHLSAMLLTNFENVNSISNIFQETHDLSVLSDPLIICIYLRTTDNQFKVFKFFKISSQSLQIFRFFVGLKFRFEVLNAFLL